MNTKTVAYKLSKNDWVMPFFVIFRFAREKLLVTVSLDHPVPDQRREDLNLANIIPDLVPEKGFLGSKETFQLFWWTQASQMDVVSAFYNDYFLGPNI